MDAPDVVDVPALHESLERLAAFDPQQERTVELRYFGGLTIDEAAEVVGISPATVVREWTIAKAWRWGFVPGVRLSRLHFLAAAAVRLPAGSMAFSCSNQLRTTTTSVE